MTNEKRVNNTLAIGAAKPMPSHLTDTSLKKRFFITINFHLKEIDIPINLTYDGSARRKKSKRHSHA